MTKNKKIILNVLIILLVPVITIIALLNTNFTEILVSLKKLNYLWLFVSFLLIILWQFLIGAILTNLAKFFYKPYQYHQGFFNALIASFFHGITPSASGGQIIQTYVFKKQGVDASESICILWLDFIIYQATLCSVMFLLIVIKYAYFKATYSGWFGIVILGFLVDSMIIVGLYALARFEKLHIWISTKGISFLHKIKIIKDPEKTKTKLNDQISRFQIESKKIVGNKKLILTTVLLNVGRLLALYSVPFVIFTALGLEISFDLYLTTLAIASFVSMLSNFIPLPGASGGAEGLFILMFAHLFKMGYVQTAMIIWRLLTYYVVMIIGALCFMYVKIKEDL